MLSGKSVFTSLRSPLLLILSAQLLFLLYAAISQHTHTRDSAEYLQQANNIIHHASFYCGDYDVAEKDLSLYSRRPPGYALFLIITTLFLQVNWLALLFQAALSVFNIYIGYKILRMVSPQKSRAWSYFIMFLFFPAQFIYGGAYMAEIPFQSSLLLCIFFLLRFEESNQVNKLYTSHLFAALAYLIKPIAIFIWLLILFFSITSKSENRTSQHLALLAFFHFVLIGAFFTANYMHSGIAEYSGIGRKVIINYTVPAVLTYSYGEETARHKIDSLQESVSHLPYVMQCVQTDNFIRTTLLTRPLDFLYIQLSGITGFFLESCRWDLEMWLHGAEEAGRRPSLISAWKANGLSGINQIFQKWSAIFTLYYLLVFVASLLIFLFFIRGVFSSGIRRRFKVFLLLIIAYFMLLTGPSASARFRLPVFPLIAIMAVAGIPGHKKSKASPPQPLK